VSEQDVENARRGIEALRGRDWDALAVYFDPHILVRTDPNWPDRFIYGRDAVIAWLRENTALGGT
jgi:hypothetical protein